MSTSPIATEYGYAIADGASNLCLKGGTEKWASCEPPEALPAKEGGIQEVLHKPTPYTHSRPQVTVAWKIQRLSRKGQKCG